MKSGSARVPEVNAQAVSPRTVFNPSSSHARLTTRPWVYILPALLLLAITLPHLDQGDFRTDTARYAAVGLQAWQDHTLFWTPHLQPDKPYFNKPPLVFWIHGLALDLFGVGLIPARLPSILAALGCLLLTIALTRRLLGPTTALAAGMTLSLTYEFVRRTREISLDMWQLCFILATLWLVLRAWPRGKSSLVIGGIPLGLALMCKPLTAFLVVPFLFIVMYKTDHRRHLWGLLAVALLVAAPWHLSMWHLHGEAFTSQYFGREVMHRTLGQLQRQPCWYYFVEMGRSYWPWMPAAAAGIWLLFSGRYSPHRKNGLALSGVWLALWFLAITLFPDKRPRYELPLYPALSVFAGAALVRLPWRARRNWIRGRAPIILSGLIVTASIIVAILPLRVQMPPDPHLVALTEWGGQAGPDPIYSAALSTNDEGLFFLKTGRWPLSFPRRHERDQADFSEGIRMVYSAEIPVRPGPNEETVFESGHIRVTRLGKGGWQPRLEAP